MFVRDLRGSDTGRSQEAASPQQDLVGGVTRNGEEVAAGSMLTEKITNSFVQFVILCY